MAVNDPFLNSSLLLDFTDVCLGVNCFFASVEDTVLAMSAPVDAPVGRRRMTADQFSKHELQNELREQDQNRRRLRQEEFGHLDATPDDSTSQTQHTSTAGTANRRVLQDDIIEDEGVGEDCCASHESIVEACGPKRRTGFGEHCLRCLARRISLCGDMAFDAMNNCLGCESPFVVLESSGEV